MARILFASTLLFLLPFALFAVYAAVSDYLAARKPGGQSTSAWQNPPIGRLAATGSVLVIGVILYLAATTTSGGRPGGTYHPPTVKDGKIQPGYVD